MVTQHINKIALSLLLLTTLQGCASMSKDECLGADWAGIGYRDGSNGYQESRFNKHSKACAEHKIGADFSAYQQGRQRGLVQVYCKPRKGYYEGLNGRGYGNVCPSHLERNFLSAYNYGVDIYKLGQDANQIRKNIQTANNRIATQDQEIAVLQRQLQYTANKQKTKSRGIKHHIDNEYHQVTAKLEVKIPRVLTKLHLKKKHERKFYALLELAEKRGRVQTRLSWKNEYSHHANHDGQSKQKLRHRLRDIDHQIKNTKAELARQAHGPKPMKKLNRLVDLAEYAGELDMQLKMLQRLHDKYEVRDLANFHYQHELAEFKSHGHGQHKQPAPGPHHGKSRKQLQREIRQLQHLRDRELEYVHNQSHQLGLVEQDIRHQKSNSPFR